MLVLAILRFAINFTRRYATARTGIRVEARMRELLYQAYLRYPRAFYDRHATGQVVSRATNDLYPIRYFIGWGMTQGIQSLMMIFGIAVVLFLVNVKLAAIALVAMPAVGLLAFSFARKVMPVSRQVQQLKADVTEAADEAVVGIEMVQAFGREDDVQARFARQGRAVRDGVLRQARIEAAFLPGLLFLPTLSIGAVVLFGGRDVIGGTLTLRRVLPLLPTAPAARLAARGARLDPLARAARDRVRVAQLRLAAGDRDDPRADAPDARCPEGPLGGALPGRPLLVRHRLGGALAASTSRSSRARSSRSAGRPVPARRRCSTCCRASTTRPTGRVLVGGVDARDVPIAELRTRGRDRDAAADPLLDPAARQPDRRAPRRAVGRGLAACEAAGVAQFAAELPDGYDTLIGERGVNLSGGQRQRVALARALVAGARVVVLDDPMSAVDTQTERHLVENLRPALAGRTVLIATQRLSTVEVADRAVVLDDGVIVESGTPQELLARGGVFASLFGEEVSAAA